MARATIPFNFTSGRYRAILRTTYTDGNYDEKHKDSEPFELPYLEESNNSQSNNSEVNQNGS